MNRSGAEYACAEGWDIWDGPTNTNAAVQAMVAWHINAVRIPLNEDYWLGINGVKPAYSGARYHSAIASHAAPLERFGITPPGCGTTSNRARSLAPAVIWPAAA